LDIGFFSVNPTKINKPSLGARMDLLLLDIWFDAVMESIIASCRDVSLSCVFCDALFHTSSPTNFRLLL
jgi:hypothetical protein